MRHAVYVPPFASFGDVNLLVDLACAAEQAGWDGFFLWDHLLYQDDVPFVDAWIALAAIAAATGSIRLGPLITPLPRRRPWKVARESVTLDHLSAGRLVLRSAAAWAPVTCAWLSIVPRISTRICWSCLGWRSACHLPSHAT